MSWGEGYVTEIEYSTGYFAKPGPRFTQGVLTLQGAEARGLEAPTYLELGFGQGLTLVLHAAANRGDWWGTDFNPSHVLGATALAEAAGADLRLLDDSFEQLASRDDLPQFDMIALHGIWSWVSERNMDSIVAILARRLKPGGTVYISYNNLTGWAALAPLRELLARRRLLLGPGADPVAEMKDGLAFAQTLAAADARYFQAAPAVKAWLEQLTKLDPVYLVHEYFDAHWKLMSFPEILERLSDAKLGFAGTADPLKAVEEVILSEDARQVTAGLDHPILREMVLDYFTMTQLRSDYFQRGARRIPACDLTERLEALRFIPTADPVQVPMKIGTPRGEVPLNAALYSPLIEFLAKCGYRPIDFAEIASAMEGRANELQLRKMLLTLIGADRLSLAHPPETTDVVAKRTRTLNASLLERSGKFAGVSHLASPVTGGGVGVGLLDQVFLLARQRGHARPDEWADFAQGRLDAFGKRVILKGEEITDRGRARDYLVQEAQALADQRLPILAGLGIA